MADNTEFITYQIQVDTKSGQINIDGVTKKFEQADRAFNKLRSDISKGLPDLNKELEGTSAATGAATTSVLELGRVVSDAPYGIRGMANNISQLASNMLFGAQQIDKATGKAIGFGGVLNNMGKAFLGPLGILFAIQAVIAVLDGLYGGMKKAIDVTADFTKLVDTQAAKLIILNSIINNSNISLEEKQGIVSDVNKEFKNLNITLDEQGNLTKKSQENLDLLTASLIKNAKAQSVLDKIAEQQSLIVEIEIERARRIAEGGVGAFTGTLDDLENQRQKYIDRYNKQLDKSNLNEVEKKKSLDAYMKSSTMERFEALANFRKGDLEDAKKNTDELLKIITNDSLFSIYSGKNGKKSVAKITPFATPEELELEVKSQLDAVESYNKKIEMQELSNKTNILLRAAQTEEEKKAIKLKYEKEKLDITLKYEEEALNRSMTAEKDANAKRYDTEIKLLDKKQKAFIDKTNKNDKISEESRTKLIADAIKETEEAKTKAFLNLGNNVKQIEEQYKPLFELFRTLAKARRDSIGGDSEIETEQERLRRLYEVKKFWADQFNTLTSGVTDFVNGEYDRQLTIEQNKTNALNNELNERLLNENLSKDERKRIQLQIGANDEALRKKQEAIEKKRFKLNKAANIATASINTYLAASQILADPSFTGRPIARFVAMATTITTGLLNVAKIARQKFQSSAGSGGQIGGGFGGGSGSGNGREFNFNLAGSSDRNQIAEAIGSRFDQPLRAYVVSRDVTTQQQIDADIRSNASF